MFPVTSTLSYDWQMGSVSLVTRIADSRVLVTLLTAIISLSLVSRTITHYNRCKHNSHGNKDILI